MTRTTAPYGTWRSPIATEDLLKGALGLAFPTLVDGSIYWMEARPAEAGRTVIVRRDRSGVISDCLPPPFSARSRVHEYGGICYAVAGDRLYFVNFSDQRIYAVNYAVNLADNGNPDLTADDVSPDVTPVAVTPADGRRYADLVVDRARNRLIVVAEEDQDGSEPRNFIAAVDLGAEPGQAAAVELAAGHDFFASPRLSPDGRTLVWLSWDHPAMPWDGTTLWRARLDEAGMPVAPEALAGSATESIFQPEFTHDGSLIAISDRSGWWNLERIAPGPRRPLRPHAADFGLPLWQFGMRTFTECHDGRLACTWQAPEGDQLGLLALHSGALEELHLPWTQLSSIVSDDHDLVFIGAGPDRFAELVRFEVDGGRYEIIRRSSELNLTTADIAAPEALHYPSGPDGQGDSAHAYFYQPTHRAFDGPSDERPPLLVMSHGGPTASTAPVLNLKVQFWTSRGFAVLDVNYRGSTGYGRAYRDKLKGAWGIVDVEDCVAGARFLVRRGAVDPERLAIRGSSAGGFTTLAALTFHDLFSAGASLYGIGDLEALAQDTHKFESRYLDSLVGPYPEAMDVYRARSPIHHVDQLACPVIFLQGLEDRIVPPAQAEAMVAALEAKGLPVAYVAFEGEQHGFRQAPNIRRALEAELDFYGRVFGFTPADAIDPVPIRNL
ncbi:MAG: S9 family peptidase [Gammaproteobacteria bacterium]|nr:S9 family peptidase [Gammaproteobacteria bacterium]